MTTKEMYLFKNEIYNRIREFEQKINIELSNKNSEIKMNLSSFNDKMNSMMEANRALIESFVSQKLNIEKINELVSNKRSTDETLLSQDTKIKNILSEIEKIKYRYEKMVSENIIIPGYVGLGCDLRNIGDFIRNVMKEMKKIKDDNERKKKEEKEIKAKVDLVSMNMTNMIEYNSKKIKELTSTKDNEIDKLLDDKLKAYKEQSSVVNQNLVDNQNKIEEKVKELGIEIEKINDTKLDINPFINNKFEEINKKEEEINLKLLYALEELKEFQNMKNELTDLIKNLNNSKTDDNKRSQNRKSQKNLVNKPENIRNIGTITTNNDLPDVNKRNHTLSPNNFSNKNLKKKISIRQKTKKNTNTINTISDFSSDKKTIVKENILRKTSKNLKTNLYINKEKEKDTKVEPSKKTTVTSINTTNQIMSNGFKIRDKIFQKTLNNLKIDKKEKEKEKKKIVSKLSLNSFMKKIGANNTNNKESKIKIVNKPSKQTLSMSDDKGLKIIKILQTPNKSNINNNNNNLKSNNDKILLSLKNIHTSSRKIKIIDCNLVNLNLLDLPNINDINSNSFSNSDELLYKPKKRKIKSVEAKRVMKEGTNHEKIYYKFYSSRAIRTLNC